MQLVELSRINWPSRGAAEELRRQFVRLMRDQRPAPGTRLMTEEEMVELTRVSRSTVRRALGPLERDGWIDRRPGAGTFVGLRINDLLETDGVPAARETSLPATPEERFRVRRSRGIIRVAVLIFNIGDLAHDWYTPGVLAGLDDAGPGHQIVLELLGDRDGDVDSLTRRLELSHPDVLIVLSNQPRHAFVIRDAQRLGIICFVSGTPLRGLDVPVVTEDNRHAMTLAVTHLKEKGFRRIGLTLPRIPEAWVFERHEAFVETAGAAPQVEAFTHWLGGPATSDQREAEEMHAFITSNQLDALIPAHLSGMLALDTLVRSRKLSVPRDLSVVSFEQDHAERKYLGLPDAARIQFPLKLMGQTLAAMARAAIDQLPVPPRTILPTELLPGSSVGR